jgi:two-component system, chemotaxis family, chemotaxis protein CheY
MFNANIKVLVVDDMMTMRKLVSKSLKEIGFTDITEASDGAKAWETINGASPQFGLIVSDWNMPNCTGLDLLKRVRADKRTAHIPLVLVTAEAEVHQIKDALAARVSGYVIKPFTTDKLKMTIEEAYKRAYAAA